MDIIKIGADIFPPYQYIENDIVKGIDANKVMSIFNELNIKYEMVLDNWNQVFEKFINKDLDVIFQIQKSEDRMEKFYFSNVLRKAKTVYIYKMTNDIKPTDHVLDIINKDWKICLIKDFVYGNIIDTVNYDVKREFYTENDIMEYVSAHSHCLGVIDFEVYNYILKSGRYKNLTYLEEVFYRDLYVAFNDKSIRDLFNEKL